MVPSSSSNSSTFTSSGWSTRPRARYSSSSLNAPPSPRATALPRSLAGAGQGEALRAQELAHGLRGLRSAREPSTGALGVDGDRRRVGLGVVLADRLDHTTV